MRALAIAVLVAIAARIAPARADGLADLASDDPKQVAAAVGAIEQAPAAAPDARFAAAHACETALADPARALALYERILRESPDAGVAVPAERRAAALRALVGAVTPADAAHAREYAALIATADARAPSDVAARVDALARSGWPGAADAALWLADWLRRTAQFADADARYAEVIARWPGTRAAHLAARGAAGAAVDAGDWSRGIALAEALDATDAGDRAIQADLVRAARRGRRYERIYAGAWWTLAAACAALAASLIEACARGGWRRPALVPPVELWFAAPIAAVLIGVALTAHRLIAPAVALISIVGLALAWISGATLDLLRARQRRTRLRAAGHVIACVAAVGAIAIVAVVRDGLLDLLVQTVSFGPE